MFRVFEGVLLTLLLFSVALPVSGQSRIYDVILWGDTIGYMKTNKVGNQSNFVMTVTSEVKFSFLGKRELTYDFSASFANGLLTKGSTRNTMNGDLRSSSKVFKTSTGYDVTVDDKNKQITSRSHRFSTVRLYFDEPRNMDHLFSERFGEECELKYLGNHQYELSLPNGKENIYSYKDGVCTQVEVDHPLATLYFKLRKP